MKQNINGWLVIDKPEGMNSTKVVTLVKKLSSAKKVGHGGTLDPFASGLLPIALGEATKLMEYCMSGAKTYEFTAVFGEATDTDDLTGKTINKNDVIPTEEEIKKAIPAFIGKITQVPPKYSAIRINGERSYDLAREGKEVELKPREVEVHSLELLEYKDGKAAFKMVCGKGTYVRSIARDLAYKLGTYAHVAKLRRTKVGKFNEKVSISLEKLEEMVHSAPLETLPIEYVLDDIPVLEIAKTNLEKIRYGQSVKLESLAPNQNERICVTSSGKLVAIGVADGGYLKPVRVFNN